tara:strand:+ start:1237 stop:1452 length:216 start_codon:yes stop_codon:yes gene_type:complete
MPQKTNKCYTRVNNRGKSYITCEDAQVKRKAKRNQKKEGSKKVVRRKLPVPRVRVNPTWMNVGRGGFSVRL